MLKILEDTIFRADMLLVILLICFAEAIIMYPVFRFGCKNKDLAEKFYKIGCGAAFLFGWAALVYLQWFHECAGGPVICDCTGLLFVALSGCGLSCLLFFPFTIVPVINDLSKWIKSKKHVQKINKK